MHSHHSQLLVIFFAGWPGLEQGWAGLKLGQENSVYFRPKIGCPNPSTICKINIYIYTCL